MTLEIRATASPGEIRVALCRDGRLEEYAIWRPGAPDGVGDLHQARITARNPAMAGAFVALADRGEGFLPDSEGARGLSEGDAVSVRITRAAQGGKGPRLSARLTDVERASLADTRLRRGPGALAELAARHPAAALIVDDAALAATLPRDLRARMAVVPHAWDEALAAETEGLGEPVAALPGGMRAHVTPTPALVAIDLDSAAATAGRGPRDAALFAANRLALPALAREIRLRNLAGAILVDFAGLPPRRRAALGPILAESLASDPLRPRLLGFTALGLAEIVRPRTRPPLHELLAGPHAAGLAALRKAAAESAARPAWPPRLRAAPAVVAALQADPVALPDLARRSGRPLILLAEPGLAPCGWALEE